MRKSDKQQQDEWLKISANISYFQTKNRTTDERCALACDMSVKTWNGRCKNPQKFTIEEIYSLARLWGCKPEAIQYGKIIYEEATVL